jgi:hypothetical protein
MSKKSFKAISLLLILTLLVSLLVGCGQSSNSGQGNNNTSNQKKFMTFGAPPASSNLYPYWVAVGKAIQTVYPEFQINVSESQGAIDITKRVRSGDLIVGNSMSNTDYENYNGLGAFNGDPFKDVRILWYYDFTPIQMIVAKDSGVKSISDLNGKKFNPGGTGTAAAIITKQICEVLGVNPNYFEAGQADAGDAVSNRQIIGVVKAGPAPDSFVMQIGATIPIDLISFTDEQIKTITEKYPYLIPVTIPAGTYKGIDHDVKTVQVMMGAQTTSKLSQEDGYKMLKAMNENGREVWANAYPLGAKNDLLKLTLMAKTPLHASAVQYLKEKGYDVPKELIPPEYKETK